MGESKGRPGITMVSEANPRRISGNSKKNSSPS